MWTCCVCGRDDVVFSPGQKFSTRKMCDGCREGARKARAKKARGSARARRLGLLRAGKDGPCADCGRSFPAVCMDFDHPDPSLKTAASGGRSARHSARESLAAALRIMSECELVCANCHRVRTEGRGDYLVKRGSPAARGQIGGGAPSRYRKMRRRAEEARLLIASLKDGPCSDCMGRFPPVAMDFDHVGGKSANVSLLVRAKATRGKVLSEVAKCELVCANCHRVRTEGRAAER